MMLLNLMIFILMQENSFLITCPCCKSQFLIDDSGDAMVFRGPARFPLVKYNARLEGSQLHIFN